MIGFSKPHYHEVLPGVNMAVFTVTDTPGSQYVYRNRDIDWLRAYMEGSSGNLQGVAHATNFHGRPSLGHLRSPEALGRWWIGQQDVYPFISTGEGIVIRIAEDQRGNDSPWYSWRMPGGLFIFVLLLGSGKSYFNPCPLYSYWCHSLPRKIRRRRKWETRQNCEWVYRGPGHRWGGPLWEYGRDLYRNLYSPPNEADLKFRDLMKG